MVSQPKISWVLLSYRVPREPSTPRIAIWRRLKKLGVVQVGDGLVALPHDARTKEHLEWVSAMVADADGDATVWIASTTQAATAGFARQMSDERQIEYQALLDETATLDRPVSTRTLGRLRRQWRRIERRDYMRAPLRDESRLAIEALVDPPNASQTKPGKTNKAQTTSGTSTEATS